MDYVFLSANGAFETITGLPREEIIGKKLSEVISSSPSLSFDWMDLYRQAAKSKNPVSLEYFIPSSSRVYEVTAYEEVPGRFVTVFHDITKYKEREEKLLFECSELFALFDSIHEIIYVSDPHTYEIVYVNRWTEEQFGKKVVGGICYREFQNREAPCPFCTNSIILHNNYAPYRWEYYNPVLERYYLITDRLIPWPDGRNLRFELAIDITEQKKLEQDLAKSEARWRATLRSIGDIIVTTDREGSMTYLNPAGEAFTGFSLEKLAGKSFAEVFSSVFALSSEDFILFFREALGKRCVIRKAEVLKKIEEERYFALGGAPFCDSRGEIQGAVFVFHEITAIRKLEQELEKRENLYRTILSSVQDILFTLDIEERYTGIYGQWIERYHLTPEHLLGKSVYDIFDRESARVHHEANQRALRGEYVVYDWSVVWEGEDRHFRTSLSPIKEGNEIKGIVGIGRDITELERTQRLNQRLLDSVPYPVCLVNRDRRILAQNKATERIAKSKVGDICWFKFHGVDILPEPWREEFEQTGVLPPEARCSFCRADEVLEKQESIVEEVKLKDQVWETGWVPLGSDTYLHYVIDITKYKEMEKQLREERDRTQKYLDLAAIIFLILNPQGEVAFINRRGSELLGYPPEEIVGKNWFRHFLPPEESARLEGVFRHLIKGEVEPVEYLENEILARDGTRRLIAWHNTILCDEAGKIVAALSAGEDITEKRQKEKELFYMSSHDNLTGLYNRYFLEKEIERFDAARIFPIGAVVVDVNGLKLVNDSYGHERGDELLKITAELLQDVFQEPNVLARFGGDEFVVLSPHVSLEDLQRISRGIKERTRGVSLEGIPLSLSIGVGAKGSEDEPLREVIRRAEEETDREKLAESRSIRSAVIHALLKALEAKSYETEIHALRMEQLGLSIAEKLSLPSGEISRLKLAVMLHDIGKITIPEEVLKKPNPLTQEEWAIVKRHPESGYRIVLSIQEFAHVAEEVYAHHEWWNGSGYPRGLRGEEIPLLARIIALLDAYEVMCYGRPYKRPMSHEEIVAEFKRCAGIQFDPHLVEIFLTILNNQTGDSSCL